MRVLTTYAKVNLRGARQTVSGNSADPRQDLKRRESTSTGMLRNGHEILFGGVVEDQDIAFGI